ncbi:MAG: insulinase family protein, partial [Thermoplasmata archaeon]|nr:insulinase family protein [Thermoplasmata archaeon]
RLIYGKHPYARRVTGYPKTVSRIGRSDIARFHRTYFRPQNITLGVSGDFDEMEMKKLLERVFGDWKPEKVKFPELPEIASDFGSSCNFIEKEGFTQSSFLMGHPGLERLNPDFYAVAVMNFILGNSGFNSRLMTNVRTRSGLAYSVGSYFLLPKLRGLFICWCQTRTDQTHAAMEKILAELERIRTEEVTDEELEQAKNSFINKFVFNFETAHQIVSQEINLEYQGLPDDYLETYLDRIRQITKKDLIRVAQKYIQPDKMTIIVLGDEKALSAIPVNWKKFQPIKIGNGGEKPKR